MKLNLKIVVLTFLVVLFNFKSFAQDSHHTDSVLLAPKPKEKTTNAEISKYLNKGLNFYLDKNKKASVRIMFFNQMWARNVWNNPGTRGAGGEEIKMDQDLIIRRFRWLNIVDLEGKAQIFSMFGKDQQAYAAANANEPVSSIDPPLKMHDLWFQAMVIPNRAMYIGAGLHNLEGISRMSSASESQNFMLDAPLVAYANANALDNQTRQFGIYTRGYAGKLDYRFSVNKPFIVNRPNQLLVEEARYYPNQNLSYKGYVAFNFKEKESDRALPFYKMTHFGTKKVFNIGAGFYYQEGACASLKPNGDTVRHANFHWAIDLFWEKKLKDSSAFTLYSAFYNYNYGPNFWRVGSLINVNSNTSFATQKIEQGGGSRQIVWGTGRALYTQVGYVFPYKLFKESGQLMPYLTATIKDYEAVAERSFQYDIGTTFFFWGYNLRLSGQYSVWPIYYGEVGRNGDAKVEKFGKIAIVGLQFVI